jgi:hypothetical protein
MADTAQDSDIDAPPESVPESPDSGSGDGPESVPGSAEDRIFEELWAGLTANEKKAAQQFLFETSIADTAREIGLEPRTLYSWDDDWRRAAEMLLDRRKDGIAEGIGALSPDAIDILRKAVATDEEITRVEKESATYILNRIAGKPTQRKEVQHETGGIEIDEQDTAQLDDMLGHLDEPDAGEGD